MQRKNVLIIYIFSLLILWQMVGCKKSIVETKLKPIDITPPLSSTLYSIIFENNSIKINWSENTDTDFHSYDLIELSYEDSTNIRAVHTFEERTYTEFIMHDVPKDYRAYFKVDVKDTSDLISSSNLSKKDERLFKIMTQFYHFVSSG